MPFGATLLPDGSARFRLWAPSSPNVDLELQADAGGRVSRRPMRAVEGGWHELIVGGLAAGEQFKSGYKFIVQTRDGTSLAVPDPASRSNPRGVHAASSLIDPHSYAWRFPDWRGRAWPDVVLYELHIGTFTAAGTFAAAASRLPELATLGVTGIQLMPVAAFPGRRNWGYDGVMQFAPAAAYGTPDDLKALIDSAHSLGLMMLLDVVYNHFGPDGNYLHAYCPEFFNDAHRTPWGAAINFDGDNSRTVRDFFLHNALYWIEEYRFDGLRLDAVHALKDSSSPDIVREIATALHEGPGRERQVHLVLENNANQASYLERDPKKMPCVATAQWDDDVHHSLHVLVSGEADGYYADYAARPLERLGRSLAEGFAYQGEYSAFRDRTRGEPSAHLPPEAFVGFLQNHDMIGNRAFGERIHQIADKRLLPAAYACLMLTPEVPMLFMGEEFAASTPFLFFCDFGPELAQSVTAGRRREFKRFARFADALATARIPDPNAESTFEVCKLRWNERDLRGHREHRELIQELLALRRHHLAPHLPSFTHGGRYEVEGGVLRAEWRLRDNRFWRLLVYFGGRDVYATPPALWFRDTVFSIGVQAAAAPQVRLEPGAVIAGFGE
jgi:maltooligosyltrehalose trehalohydrolase